ncbi:MAG: SAM-dependent methyltransferase [Firmicutes bacterium]|nr:SAM-dependent methyltransferase [Bacillota bacterium]
MSNRKDSLTEVELLRRRGPVRGSDLIDGTPVLDRKTVYRG